MEERLIEALSMPITLGMVLGWTIALCVARLLIECLGWLIERW